ncbi:MAG: type II secretion system protein [Armatimonadota bacterium]
MESNFSGKSARAGFTLVELLVVISILALLSAILQPVIVNSKRAAKKATCQSNLKQVGAAIFLYGNDWDDCYPWSIDAFTRANGEALSDFPNPHDLIPDSVTVLAMYTGGHGQIWRCPSDQQSFEAPIYGLSTTQRFPSAFDFAGTSYRFNYQIRVAGKPQTIFVSSSLRLCEDAGQWHSSYVEPNIFQKADNVLFGDGHVRFVSTMDGS